MSQQEWAFVGLLAAIGLMPLYAWATALAADGLIWAARKVICVTCSKE